MYYKIVNDGELDMNALFLLGASSKRGDDTKIGFFGSGNKYALAVLLRHGIDVKIFSGDRQVLVEKKSTEFRGENFDQIVIDGKETSFTTSMGPEWELWFALREFVCNAIDEGGFESGLVEDGEGFAGISGKTTFYVDVSNTELLNFVSNLSNYILTPEYVRNYRMDQISGVSIIRRNTSESDISETSKIYRRGLRVDNDAVKKSLFLYDVPNAEITESRVLKYAWIDVGNIGEALAASTNEDVVNSCFELFDGSYKEPDDYIERQAITKASGFSYRWLEKFKTRKLMSEGQTRFVPIEDREECLVLPDELYDELRENNPDELSFYGSFDKLGEVVDDEKVSDERKKIVQRACQIAQKRLGIVAPKFGFMHFYEEDTLGAYSSSKGMMFFPAEEKEGSRTLADLLDAAIEEMTHAIGMPDASRSFQNMILKQLARALLELEEAEKKLTMIQGILE